MNCFSLRLQLYIELISQKRRFDHTINGIDFLLLKRVTCCYSPGVVRNAGVILRVRNESIAVGYQYFDIVKD